MKRYIFIISALFAVATVAAQEDISKQMEVTKAYTPKVGQAAKLPVEPNMVDTVRLRPEIAYSITPTAWQTSFGSEKFSPAVMSVAPFEKHHPLYLRAGIGYPVQSTADLYFNPYMGSSSIFGLFFNHRGSYSKIENELGIKPKSAEMLNGGGLWGSRHFRRYKLEGSLQYDNRMYSAYGVMPGPGYPDPAIAPANVTNSFTGSSFNFGKIGGSIAFGDTFADLSRFNFQVGMNIGTAHHNSDFYQFDVDAWLKMAKMWRSKHGIELGLYERGAIGIGDISGTDAVTVMFRPRYMLSLPKFSMRAGIDVNYVNNNASLDNYVGIAPQLEFMLKIAKGYFTPYFSLTSQMLDGSFEAMSRINPYNAGIGATGWSHDIRLGFSGNVNSVFTYRVQGGISFLNDYNVPLGVQYISYSDDGTYGTAEYIPLMFTPIVADGEKYVFGVELGLQNLGGFSATLGGNVYNYNLQDMPDNIGLPKYDANLKLTYSHKKKFLVRAGAEFIGERSFFGYYVTEDALVTNSIKSAIDVSLGFEYNISDGFGIFVEGRNLANQKLYPYNYYRGLGANVMLGIKAMF